MPGKTVDKTTLRGFLEKIQNRLARPSASGSWIAASRTEDVLAEMRASDPPVHYLVRIPKGRLTQLEAELLSLDWQHVRDAMLIRLGQPAR